MDVKNAFLILSVDTPFSPLNKVAFFLKTKIKKKNLGIS